MTYLSRGSCLACKAGYTLTGTTCIDKIANCLTYNVAGTVCDQCKNTFEPNAAKTSCVTGNNAGCLTYSALDVCTACTEGKFLATPTTCTNGTIVDCLTYASNVQCSKCVDGKMLATGGATCINGIIKNCKSYLATAQCEICLMGYSKVGNI